MNIKFPKRRIDFNGSTIAGCCGFYPAKPCHDISKIKTNILIGKRCEIKVDFPINLNCFRIFRLLLKNCFIMGNGPGRATLSACFFGVNDEFFQVLGHIHGPPGIRGMVGKHKNRNV
jgi:hypothetical protein